MPMFEVAVRMPNPLAEKFRFKKWLYEGSPRVGQNVYRGAIIGRLSGHQHGENAIDVYSPIDGVISDIATLPSSSLPPFGNNEPDAGQIILKIKTGENIETSSSEEMALFAFGEMFTLFKKLSKTGSVPSTEAVNNCLKHAVSIHRV